MQILAIDPGATGAFAWGDYEGTVHVAKMPKQRKDIIELIDGIDRDNPDLHVVIEDVGRHHAGNHASASVALAKSRWFIQGVVETLAIDLTEVSPRKWHTVIRNKPKRTPKESPASYRTRFRNVVANQVRARFPRAELYTPGMKKITIDVADSLGILLWSIKEFTRGSDNSV